MQNGTTPILQPKKNFPQRFEFAVFCFGLNQEVSHSQIPSRRLANEKYEYVPLADLEKQPFLFKSTLHLQPVTAGAV